MSKEKGVLRWSLLLVEDAVKIVEMATKDLEYPTDLVDKAAAMIKSIDSNFDRSSIVGKMLSNNIACCEEIVHDRKSQSMGQIHCFLILGNCGSQPTLQQPPPCSINSHQHRGKTLHQQKGCLTEGAHDC